MEILKYFLPLIALLIALLSLFTDAKEIKSLTDLIKKPKVLLLLMLIMISSIANIVYTKIENQKHKNEIARKDAEIKELLDKTDKIEKTTTDNQLGIQNLTKILKEYGVIKPQNLNISQTEKIFKADQRRKELIAESTNSNNRDKILIQYFPKDVDGEKVYMALEELNFMVSEGNANLPKSATNALYYGTNVDEESIKLVVLTLIRAGVDIKGIFKFTNGTNREHIIQIVHSKNVSAQSQTKVEELIGLTNN